MEAKDVIAIAGIGITFLVSCVTLGYTIWSNRQTSFVNTVTTSRLKWIDSLRDKVSDFIAVSSRLAQLDETEEATQGHLLHRDSLMHQIILHLNPHDVEDHRIAVLVQRVRELTAERPIPAELSTCLLQLRNATGEYLKKEWNRVKQESTGSRS
jgi:hypothetical protein